MSDNINNCTLSLTHKSIYVYAFNAFSLALAANEFLPMTINDDDRWWWRLQWWWIQSLPVCLYGCYFGKRNCGWNNNSTCAYFSPLFRLLFMFVTVCRFAFENVRMFSVLCFSQNLLACIDSIQSFSEQWRKFERRPQEYGISTHI